MGVLYYMRIDCPYWSEKCAQDKNSKSLTKPCFFLYGEMVCEDDIIGPELGFKPLRFYRYTPDANFPFQTPIEGGYYNSQTFNNKFDDLESMKSTLDGVFKQCSEDNQRNS